MKRLVQVTKTRKSSYRDPCRSPRFDEAVRLALTRELVSESSHFGGFRRITAGMQGVESQGCCRVVWEVAACVALSVAKSVLA